MLHRAGERVGRAGEMRGRAGERGIAPRRWAVAPARRRLDGGLLGRAPAGSRDNEPKTRSCRGRRRGHSSNIIGTRDLVRFGDHLPQVAPAPDGVRTKLLLRHTVTPYSLTFGDIPWFGHSGFRSPPPDATGDVGGPIISRLVVGVIEATPKSTTLSPRRSGRHHPRRRLSGRATTRYFGST